MSRIAGIILCGGASRRMGRPKYALMIGGQTLLARTVGVLREVVSPVIVVAAEGQELTERELGRGEENEIVPIVRDHRPHEGPLAGMVRGLESLSVGIEAAYISAVDLPLLKPGFVRAVVETLGDAEVAVPEIGGVIQPLAAVYRVNLLDRARELAAQGRGPRHLVEASHSVRLAEEFLASVDPGLTSLTTFSTPEEWGRIRSMVGQPT